MELIAVEIVKWGGGLLLIAAVKLLWDLNQKMGNTLGRLESHDTRIEKVEAEIKAIRDHFVTRTELLETLKRVEQQLEIMLLKAQRGEPHGPHS